MANPTPFANIIQKQHSAQSGILGQTSRWIELKQKHQTDEAS